MPIPEDPGSIRVSVIDCEDDRWDWDPAIVKWRYRRSLRYTTRALIDEYSPLTVIAAFRGGEPA